MDSRKVPCINIYLFLLKMAYILCMIFTSHSEVYVHKFGSQFDPHKHLFLGVQMSMVLSYLQIDAILKWLHVNMVNRDNECSGLLLCNHLVLNSQPSLTWGPFRNHYNGRIWRHPDFIIFWRGVHILQIFQGSGRRF